MSMSCPCWTIGVSDASSAVRWRLQAGAARFSLTLALALTLCFAGPQAKTTKKITLRLTCTACKTVRLKPIKRAKHFEICDKKPKGKPTY